MAWKAGAAGGMVAGVREGAMKVTILGGGGFLGRKLAARLAADGALGGKPVEELTLFDLSPPAAPEGAGFPVRCVGGDVSDASAMSEAVPEKTSVVFHLAAVVSAAAEADFDLGMRVNLDGTRALVERCRALPAAPRVVFTSSVASFSGGQEAVLADDARQVPANSYGAQKAMGEMLLADATRKGFLDAVCIRLPTVIVRPGRPNKAASSFVSAILREPLLGLETTYPVGEEFGVWVCSPRVAVEWFVHAATMETAALGLDRGVNPPGRRVTVAEMLAALPGNARGLVRPQPDPAIEAIVSGWPAAFTAERARRLGFSETPGLDVILRGFVEDDLEATRAERAA
ncbi:D-erythronate dehydrogenase [Roseomonas sp. CCTCC AB2023176]|uniref:D-erythronate dehydrogenase n=1 Tax=Roseomonas sp. CCTCC AB2023176 TaxID=3342640 RepID=UPI0035DF6A36